MVIRLELAQLQADPLRAARRSRRREREDLALAVAGVSETPEPRSRHGAAADGAAGPCLWALQSSFGALPPDSQLWRVVPGSYKTAACRLDRSTGGYTGPGEAERLRCLPLQSRHSPDGPAGQVDRTAPLDSQPSAGDVMEASAACPPNLSPLPCRLRRLIVGMTWFCGRQDASLRASRRVRHRQLVQREWGFGKSSHAKGHQRAADRHSGTGKTMAAGVLAGASLTLHRSTATSVISKYIGETGQHLSASFSAEWSQTLLFGKPGPVRQTDRGEGPRFDRSRQ